MSTTERRIHCDRAVPTCSQCSRSKRACQGYALRLSWPKAGDGRRAIVARPSFRRPTRHISDASMVHTTAWDIEMHYYLTSSSQKGKLLTYLGGVSHGGPSQSSPVSPRMINQCDGLLTRLLEQGRLTLQIPMRWNPSEMSISDKDLFQYCVTTYCVLELRRMTRLTKQSPICGFPVSHQLRPQPSDFGECAHACRSHKQVKLRRCRSPVAARLVLASSIRCSITGDEAENRELEGTGGGSQFAESPRYYRGGSTHCRRNVAVLF